MNKVTWKSLLCCALIVALALFGESKVLKMKYSDGIYSMSVFYKQDKNTVDLLVIGSSHAFEDINTQMLWDDCGISSFVLGGSMQATWNSYYALKEALKTQKPKVIIFEAFMTSYMGEYLDESRMIKNTYGYHWNRNKIENMLVSIPKESRWSIMPEWLQYHNRYSMLSEEDFLKNKGQYYLRGWKGFGINREVSPMDNVDLSYVNYEIDMIPKTEEYYRATIELAQENDIPIVIVVAPYAGVGEWDEAFFRSAEKIADEYDVPFLNYTINYKDIGIDFAVDAADVAHLNQSGNKKFTAELERYLEENYDLPDHRGDEKYASWDEMAEALRNF